MILQVPHPCQQRRAIDPGVCGRIDDLHAVFKFVKPPVIYPHQDFTALALLLSELFHNAECLGVYPAAV